MLKGKDRSTNKWKVAQTNLSIHSTTATDI